MVESERLNTEIAQLTLANLKKPWHKKLNELAAVINVIAGFINVIVGALNMLVAYLLLQHLI